MVDGMFDGARVRHCFIEYLTPDSDLVRTCPDKENEGPRSHALCLHPRSTWQITLCVGVAKPATL